MSSPAVVASGTMGFRFRIMVRGPGQNFRASVYASGGQSRALMIADIALLCDSPIVLIDEIENAGIDKERALGLLQRHDKLVLVVTHDPHTALMSRRRIVMGGGAVAAVVERSPQEAALYMELGELYRRQQTYQASLRRGDHLA